MEINDHTLLLDQTASIRISLHGSHNNLNRLAESLGTAQQAVLLGWCEFNVWVNNASFVALGCRSAGKHTEGTKILLAHAGDGCAK